MWLTLAKVKGETAVENMRPAANSQESSDSMKVMGTRYNRQLTAKRKVLNLASHLGRKRESNWISNYKDISYLFLRYFFGD